MMLAQTDVRTMLKMFKINAFDFFAREFLNSLNSRRRSNLDSRLRVHLREK